MSVRDAAVVVRLLVVRDALVIVGLLVGGV